MFLFTCAMNAGDTAVCCQMWLQVCGIDSRNKLYVYVELPFSTDELRTFFYF